MPSPFPGMDPYLEHPGLWPDVHNSLVLALRDDLAPALRPRYYVAVEERTYRVDAHDLLLIGRSDTTVVRGPQGSADRPPALSPAGAGGGPLIVTLPLPHETHELYLEVRTARGHEVVTLVEMLSPTNKHPGEGRRLYEEKRLQILGSRANLVEVDLLRGGPPMPMAPAPGAHYRILVSRAPLRPRAEVYAFSVRESIPVFPLPLRPGDPEPAVDLGRLLGAVYDRAGYDLRIDYRTEPVPPLEPEDGRWARQLLVARGAVPPSAV